jgi:hypothetical protein
MWINQPSKLQPHHNLHGTRVLAIQEGIIGEGIYRIYFLSGPVISQRISGRALSEGWV